MDHYAVLGHPVAHSRSPFIHERFARQTGQRLVYGRVLAPLDGFEATLRRFAGQGLEDNGLAPGRAAGCNITVPFKFEAAALAARCTAEATLAGAANVLRFDADGWTAHNADGIGLVRDIERHAATPLAGRRLLLVGAGGAAAGALGPLLEAGPAALVLANRSPDKAQALAARHAALARQRGVRLDVASLDTPGVGFDVVINATASSLAGAPVPVPATVLGADALALDMMYGPGAQAFLDWARAHGARARDGLGMLVEQAAESFAFWRGVLPDTAPVLAALRAQVDGAGGGRPVTVATRHALRLLGLLAIGALSLQLFFLGRVALMAVVDPTSTSFQRSEGWRLLLERRDLPWQHEWVDEDRIAPALKRAVIAAEDASFADHGGIEWEAIEKAWDRNLRAEARARPTRPPRIVGGSTITQQLAKNLFLSGERHLGRKAQEFVITLMLEGLLDKRRILEIYLNNVEWGEGVFGAQAAARHYHRVSAASLGAGQAARLAVMLPAPKRFEKRLGSAYLNGRASVIVARMQDVDLP